MNNHNGIVRVVERKGDIATARPARHSTLRQVAESLSLRNVDQAAVELMAEALNRLTLLCYEVSDDGVACK